jgi:restriction system protein
MQENEVLASFEILLEELENIVESLNQEGAMQFSRSAHEEALQTLEKVKRITSFRGKVKELQKEWNTIETQRNKRKIVHRKRGKKETPTRLERGLRTPEDEFRIPILEALVQLGNSAPIGDVIDQLEKSMVDILNEYDWQELPSTPNLPRWRNTAQWARQSLVENGHLSGDSPKGIWEITDSGRELASELEEKSTGGYSRKQFMNLILEKHFGGDFRKVKGYQIMFESDTQLVYFQNYNKEADNLWYRLSEKPRQDLENTHKDAWLCLTHPVEKYAYIIPVKAIEEKIKQYGWKEDDLEISIYPLIPRNETRWHQFKWNIEKYRHEYK